MCKLLNPSGYYNEKTKYFLNFIEIFKIIAAACREENVRIFKLKQTLFPTIIVTNVCFDDKKNIQNDFFCWLFVKGYWYFFLFPDKCQKSKCVLGEFPQENLQNVKAFTATE